MVFPTENSALKIMVVKFVRVQECYNVRGEASVQKQ